MQSFATLIAVSAIVAGVSASPILARDVCGSAPTSSGSQSVLSQPTGITTASACLAQCEANTSCLSFVFGLVDNEIKCMLYAVAASSVPKQSSTNLVVYDKACSSVPAVVPTTSNPTGAATSASDSPSTGSNTGSTTGSTPGSNTGTSSNAGAAQNHRRDTCGSTPAAQSGSATPIATQTNINSLADCKAQCQANSNCKSFEFTAAKECILFNVAASAVPAPTNGQSAVVYDVGCSV